MFKCTQENLIILLANFLHVTLIIIWFTTVKKRQVLWGSLPTDSISGEQNVSSGALV